MLHVALLDDHPAVLAGLRRLIDSQPDLVVVAAAPTAAELALQLDGTRPDVLVVDYDLARGDGLGGESAMPAIARDAYDAAVARIHDTDLPVLSMLLDGEPLEAIAEALPAEWAEVMWRAERIVGRLRPRIRPRANKSAVETAHATR
jgi:CheY-like chemotaxis protein